MFEVFFSREGKRVRVPEGTTVLAAERLAGLEPDAPCGGRGSCGKCLVDLETGEGPVTVRACQTAVEKDLTVLTRTGERKYAILTGGSSRKNRLDPVLRAGLVTFPKLKLGDNRSQWDRLAEAAEGLGLADPEPNFALASELYDKLRLSERWYLVTDRSRILSMTEKEVPVYAAAFDIGTTSVVGYLLNGLTGEVLGTESRINPQTQYGADVIMRANYALEHGVEPLKTCIRACLREILEALAAGQGADCGQIYQVSIVGNTAMHHLLLGLSPASLSHAPYNPVICQLLPLEGESLDLPIHEGGRVLLLPNIAGFVGADTMGCVLCTRPDLEDAVSLMIDIGTNGEMVLGSRAGLVTCSTAAGPAFEGAKIECGMRGALGAVDHVTWRDGRWGYTTVGGGRPVGLCGSGLIDLVACMRRAGLIDESGYLDLEDGGDRFVLVPESESGTGMPVYLSQKDIREVQLAKAAIAAGICLLRQHLGLEEAQIQKVYLAGAFGNYMDPDSACEIGLIPKGLRNRITPIGNAAGEGAKLALLGRNNLDTAEALSKTIEFLELATSPDFQDCFVDELEFPK